MSAGQLAAAHTRSCARAAWSLCAARRSIERSDAAMQSSVVGSAACALADPSSTPFTASTDKATAARFLIGDPVDSLEALGFEVFFAQRVQAVIRVAVG